MMEIVGDLLVSVMTRVAMKVNLLSNFWCGCNRSHASPRCLLKKSMMTCLIKISVSDGNFMSNVGKILNNEMVKDLTTVMKCD